MYTSFLLFDPSTMILLLIPILIIIAIYFKFSDSSLSLFFWMRTGLRSEEGHYKGKVVWVVGASSGIGEELVLRISSFSPLLILSARRADLLEDVAKKCRNINPTLEVKILSMDITDMDALSSKCKEANSLFGRKVDIVVLNAGRTQRAEWTDIDPKVDEECFKINTLGPVQLTRCLLKQLGLHPTSPNTTDIQIVVISSIASFLPAMLSPSYAASKAALNAYFRLLAVEMGEKGVKVSIIAPSLVFVPGITMSAFTDTTGKSNNEVLGQPSPQHMMPQRAVELISMAATYEINECVIATATSHFIFLYLYTLFPGVMTRIINRIGAEKLRRMRTGREQ